MPSYFGVVPGRVFPHAGREPHKYAHSSASCAILRRLRNVRGISGRAKQTENTALPTVSCVRRALDQRYLDRTAITVPRSFARGKTFSGVLFTDKKRLREVPRKRFLHNTLHIYAVFIVIKTGYLNVYAYRKIRICRPVYAVDNCNSAEFLRLRMWITLWTTWIDMHLCTVLQGAVYAVWFPA